MSIFSRNRERNHGAPRLRLSTAWLSAHGRQTSSKQSGSLCRDHSRHLHFPLQYADPCCFDVGFHCVGPAAYLWGRLAEVLYCPTTLVQGTSTHAVSIRHGGTTSKCRTTGTHRSLACFQRHVKRGNAMARKIHSRDRDLCGRTTGASEADFETGKNLAAKQRPLEDRKRGVAENIQSKPCRSGFKNWSEFNTRAGWALAASCSISRVFRCSAVDLSRVRGVAGWFPMRFL